MTAHELIHSLVEVQKNNFQIRTLVNQASVVELIDQNINHVGRVAEIVAPGLLTKALEDIW